jgi:toxoflavin biosynthesis protein ToxC
MQLQHVKHREQLQDTIQDENSRFVRHRGPVTCVAGIPNCNAAVTSGYDGAVGYANLDTGTLELMGYHDHLTNKITVNDAGTRAASCSSDYTVYIWDLATRQIERILKGHSDDVEDFVFIDDSRGVSVSRDWRIIVWNLLTGAAIHIIEGHDKDVLSVAVANGRIYTSGDDMTLRVWDLETGKPIRMWGPFEDETDSCAIDPGHGHAILGCDDGVVRVFDIETGEPVAEIEAHSSGIKRVTASPDTGDILSAAYDQRILVWDANDMSLKLELEFRPSIWERSFNWTADGKRLLAGTFDGTVLVWDAATGECLGEIGERGEGNACFNDVSGTATGDILTVSDDGLLRLGRLTPEEATWIAEIEPKSGRILANAVTIDAEYGMAVSGAHNQVLHLFDFDGQTLTGEIEVPLGEGPINCVRISHHAGYEQECFVACYSGAIVRVSRQGEILKKFAGNDGAVKAVRLHPSKKIGVSCSADNSLHSWDFDGNRLHSFLGHMAIVDDVDIDPTGAMIASVSRDFTMKVYRLDDGSMVGSYSLGRRSPKAVCFVDQDTVIVTNYWGSLLRFDVTSGDTLVRHIAKNGISALARCGDHLVASSYDGALYLVDPVTLEPVNTLRSMTQRLKPSALI